MATTGGSYEWKESYSSKTTTTSGSGGNESRCCNSDVVFDKRYLRGIPGILKYIEMVGLFVVLHMTVYTGVFLAVNNMRSRTVFAFFSQFCVLFSVLLPHRIYLCGG